MSQSAGRRRGLTLGFLAGAVGAAGIVLAAVISSLLLLFLSLFVYGSGTATNLQARYAGTDLAPANRRATAVSVAMVATTFGAVAGPNSVEATGNLAEALGIPALAGLVLSRSCVQTPSSSRRPSTSTSRLSPPPRPPARPKPEARGPDRRVLVGATVMVLTQIAMVAMTPMRHQGHSLGQVGFVIGIHIGAMFLPSFITGALVDRLGGIPMAAAAGATLLAGGMLALLLVPALLVVRGRRGASDL